MYLVSESLYTSLISQMETDDTLKKSSNVNTCTVSGITYTGGGHSQLEELRAAIHTPCFSSE
ncbi:hypothetical protein V1478_002750 [Vespula squamosa]|uniref:Uncharacterized protein n=1 Tax=Vespula squamosa TaxID=30214 RepID=A0ABD2BSK6_VESSQ